MRSVFPILCLSLVLLSCVTGCDAPVQPPAAKATSTQDAAATPVPPTDTTDVARIALGDYIGPLDSGAIEVAGPDDWYRCSRGSKNLIRYQISSQSSYPTIIVTAEDQADPPLVTRENVAAFAKQVTAMVGQKASLGKLIMPVAPVVVASFIGVIYQGSGKATYRAREIRVDRLFVVTVVAGRKYQLELRAREGDATKFRSHLLAVAAGIHFLKAPSPVEPEAPEPEQQEPVAEGTEPDLEASDADEAVVETQATEPSAVAKPPPVAPATRPLPKHQDDGVEAHVEEYLEEL